MTEHVGGPESEEALRQRHQRYLAARDAGTVFCFAVILQPDGTPVGSVNFWERQWQDKVVYEMGWGIVPEFQGRGHATAAVQAAIDVARNLRGRDAVHAFPSVDNGASNAVCRKAGFELLGPVEFEYPKGHWALSNDWRLGLR